MGLHGKPDWGMQLKSTVYSMDDLAELAVRLGSISRFDRRGDIIFQDDFGCGLGKCVVWGAGTGNLQEISAEYFSSGGYSLKLTGGKTSAYHSSYRAALHYPVASKIGFEASVSFESYVNYIDMYIYLYKENEYLIGLIRYDDANNKLIYYDKNNNPVTLADDFLFHVLPRLFNRIKLVVDFENNEYERLIINETTYSLVDIPLRSISGSYTPRIEVFFRMYSRSGGNDVVFLDDVILTQNEP